MQVYKSRTRVHDRKCSAIPLQERRFRCSLFSSVDRGRRLRLPCGHRLGAIRARGAHLWVRLLVVDGAHDAWGHRVRALFDAHVRWGFAASHLRNAQHVCAAPVALGRLTTPVLHMGSGRPAATRLRAAIVFRIASKREAADADSNDAAKASIKTWAIAKT